MDLVLKCKNIDVALVECTMPLGEVHLKKVLVPEYMPLLAKFTSGQRNGLQEWLNYRSIPQTRRNLVEILQRAGVKTATALVIKNLGLSLSDSYWFAPQDNEMKWEQVNLFDNVFDKRPVESKSGNHVVSDVSFSPNSSSNGELVKFWKIENGNRILYKESTRPYYQQAYNEKFADQLLKKMEIPHVSYEVKIIEDMAYSVCSMFTSADREYVPAWYILEASKKRSNEDNYQHFLKCVDKLEIPCTKSQIDTMLSFDYLINNSDRHYGNFGFLRDVNTLRFLGMAPLFDHGNSMWYQALSFDIDLRKDLPSKPFRARFFQQNEWITESVLPVEQCTDDFIYAALISVYKHNIRFDNSRIEHLFRAVLAARQQILLQQEKQNTKLFSLSSQETL